MTDEQLKAIGYAVVNLGEAINELGVALLLKTPPIDPPPIDPPIDPPPVDPPPPVESEFMRAVVLDHTFLEGNRFLAPYTFDFEPTNPFGESFGVSFQFVYNAPPNMASPLSLRNDENPFFQLFARGPTALGVVFALKGGGWFDFDAVVDDMVGRSAHAVIGYDHFLGLATFWIDGVPRATATFSGIGLFPDKTPPLIINSTVAGHQSGDITPIRLVYAVGAAPTSEDVARLSGIVPHAPGRFIEIVNGVPELALYGEEFTTQPYETPKLWEDGGYRELERVRNNPPIELRWRAK